MEAQLKLTLYGRFTADWAFRHNVWTIGFPVLPVVDWNSKLYSLSPEQEKIKVVKATCPAVSSQLHIPPLCCQSISMLQVCPHFEFLTFLNEVNSNNQKHNEA